MPAISKKPTNWLVYITFLIIGTSYLWPWNCFLSAISYFYSRIEDQNLKGILNSSLMSISTITSTIVFIYLADKQRNANYPRRIIYGEIITAIVFLFLALSCFVSLPNDKIYFFYLLVSMFVATVGTSYTQNGSFAVVSLYEPVYTQAVMVGQALSGIVPPLGSMLSALSYKDPGATGFSKAANTTTETNTQDGGDVPTSPDTSSALAQWSSFAYFIAATSLALAAIIMYITSINKSQVLHEPDEGDFLRYSDIPEEEDEGTHLINEQDENLREEDSAGDDDENNNNTNRRNEAIFNRDESERREAVRFIRSATSFLPKRTRLLRNTSAPIVSTIQRPQLPRRLTHTILVEDIEAAAKGEHHTSVPLTRLARKLKVPAATVYLVFSVSLAYPVFASSVLSNTFELAPQLFFPLAFFVWNLGDLIGRIICGVPAFIVKRDSVMIIYGIARLLFIPLFFLLSMSKNRSDFVYLGLHLFFGITNGHLCSSALIQFPSYVDDTEREAAGGFMTVLLSLGLTTGSLFSFVLTMLNNEILV